MGKKIDINRAEWAEISTLPGISDEVARRIVEARAARGRFERAEDLIEVKGVKEKRLKIILPFISNLKNN